MPLQVFPKNIILRPCEIEIIDTYEGILRDNPYAHQEFRCENPSKLIQDTLEKLNDNYSRNNPNSKIKRPYSLVLTVNPKNQTELHEAIISYGKRTIKFCNNSYGTAKKVYDGKTVCIKEHTTTVKKTVFVNAQDLYKTALPYHKLWTSDDEKKGGYEGDFKLSINNTYLHGEYKHNKYNKKITIKAQLKENGILISFILTSVFKNFINEEIKPDLWIQKEKRILKEHNYHGNLTCTINHLGRTKITGSYTCQYYDYKTKTNYEKIIDYYNNNDYSPNKYGNEFDYKKPLKTDTYRPTIRSKTKTFNDGTEFQTSAKQVRSFMQDTDTYQPEFNPHANRIEKYKTNRLYENYNKEIEEFDQIKQEEQLLEARKKALISKIK